MEKHTSQVNIIWSSIYLIELIYQEFIKHIYNILDKSKIMCENKYKIHKIGNTVLYVYIVHLLNTQENWSHCFKKMKIKSLDHSVFVKEYTG